MNIDNYISELVLGVVTELYGQVNPAQIQIQKTRKEFEGDYTLVTFPLLKLSRKAPEATATEIGEKLVATCSQVSAFNVIKGFLNISLSAEFWQERFAQIVATENYGQAEATGKTIMVEYSSPNTNKPLHLGHIRNNLLGYSVSQILAANGHKVIKANLVNDRGIHICKSMVAWQRYGNGATPQSTGIKGDHLVGDYYVEFDKHYKAEIAELVAGGMSEEEAKKSAPILLEAQDMLRKWEAKDEAVRELWQTMNGWVYEGFDVTYKALGVDFDKVYYESQTYLLGKSIVAEGLEKGIFFRKEDGSVWIDLTADGLDQKLLLRGDGTSVYMTQDLGTALQRFEQNNLDGITYVVGNEQNYHFQVLKLVLKKLGYQWSDDIYHLSYGMVELPEGKMKSREGTVVDADDLIADMYNTAKETSLELGKIDNLSEQEQDELFSSMAVRAPYAAYIPLTFTAQTTPFLVTGELWDWAEVKAQLTVGETYTVTNCATGESCRMVYRDGESHAHMTPAAEYSNLQMVKKWLGESNSYYKIAVVVEMGEKRVAASLQYDNATAHVYFQGSASHVLGMVDKEHDSLVQRAAGR